ncbi:hypothetical protein F4779DRAFT_612831 [Xylariaceae sp. FL0662B]|nr:hypothetical protein F4779DRAFT_612831 [Xylariaceae sp. FL0662B]
MWYLFAVALLLQTALGLPSFLRNNTHHQARDAVVTPATLAPFRFDPFNLTHMCIECNKEKPDDPMFGFDWVDPNSEESCSCKQDWQWDGVTTSQGDKNNYNTDYFVCGDEGHEIFQFKFSSLFDMSNFSLTLTHMFMDSKDFQPPTWANLFAQKNIILPSVRRSNMSISYSSSCHGCSIEAEINGVTI